MSFDEDDPASRIVCWYPSESVQTVIVDGKLIMHDRQILTMDEGEVLEDARRAARMLTEGI